MYEIFEQLLEKHNVTAYKVSKETGIATATLSDWKNGRSTPKQDKMQKIADYFGVSLEYLLTGKEFTEPSLTEKDTKGIDKDLNKVMKEFRENNSDAAYYNGIELKEEDLDLIESAMKIALEQIKIKNKNKYTPKKYRK